MLKMSMLDFGNYPLEASDVIIAYDIINSVINFENR